MFEEADATERQKDMERFFADLDNETDRGMVLATGCYFDRLLKECLGSYFAEGKATDDLLADGNGLGSFSARNRCCLSLRITEPLEYRTLKIMAGIRNKFAHTLRTDFTDSNIRDLTLEMARCLFEEPIFESLKLDRESPRRLFNLTAFCLNDKLWLRPLDTHFHVADYPKNMPEHVANILDDKIK